MAAELGDPTGDCASDRLESPSSAVASAAAEPGVDPCADDRVDDYAQLQRRLLLATLSTAVLAALFTAVVFDVHTAGSVLVGSLSGVVYLRLLGRSVARLGPDAKKVGKLQLLVPVVLVLSASRLPQLELLPALLGFLLYKPALILQVALDLRAGRP
ncbi:MAG: hypothetical protein RLZZ106_344 [Cyanobacteriota bacterium]